MIKRLVKTLFPKFGDDELACVSSSSSSNGSCASGDDDSALPDLDELSDYSDSEDRSGKYRSKEDQDVAVFMSIAEKMSVKSLLFILQMHARSMHNIPEAQLEQTLNQIKSEGEGATVSLKKKVKKLRFAEILGGQKVRVEAQEIPHFESFTKEERDVLWWTKEEMRATRSQAVRIVRFFKQNRPQYTESIEILANSAEADADEIMVEHHMKKLSQDSSLPRGLEVHICKFMTDIRSESIQAVLVEQEKIKMLNEQASVVGSPKATRRHKSGGSLGSDVGSSSPTVASTVGATIMQIKTDSQVKEEWEQIRTAYNTCSKRCQTLAYKLAECDHIEALKASLSKWTSTKPMSRWEQHSANPAARQEA